jgi:hypothetical protein
VTHDSVSLQPCVFLLELANLNCLHSDTELIHIKICSKAVEKLANGKFDYLNPVKFYIRVSIVVSGNTVTAKLKYYWIEHVNVVALLSNLSLSSDNLKVSVRFVTTKIYITLYLNVFLEFVATPKS